MKHSFRYIWIGLGTVSLVLGTIGIVLPLLPTVPFYMATVFCFAKGSPRLHRWFLTTSLYQKHLQEFSETKAMSLHSKVTIMCSVTLMMGIALWFMRHLAYALPVIGTVWLIHVYCFIFIIKTAKKDEHPPS